MPGIFQECLVWMYVCVRIVAASSGLMAKRATRKDRRPFNDLYKSVRLLCLLSRRLVRACNTAKCRMTPARGAGRALPQWLADSKP